MRLFGDRLASGCLRYGCQIRYCATQLSFFLFPRDSNKQQPSLCDLCNECGGRGHPELKVCYCLCCLFLAVAVPILASLFYHAPIHARGTHAFALFLSLIILHKQATRRERPLPRSFSSPRFAPQPKLLFRVKRRIKGRVAALSCYGTVAPALRCAAGCMLCA